jgi:hypothetical protein
MILSCPCGKHLEIDALQAGERAMCPACGAYACVPADPVSQPSLAAGELPLPALLAPPQEPATPDATPVAQTKEPVLDLTLELLLLLGRRLRLLLLLVRQGR